MLDPNYEGHKLIAFHMSLPMFEYTNIRHKAKKM